MRAGGWLFSAGVMAAGYVLFAGSVTVSEIIAGAICLAAAGIFLVMANRAVKRRFDFRIAWWVVLPALARALVVDTALVGAVLLRSVWRPVGGRMVRQAFRHDAKRDDDFTRTALVVIAASAAPNGFVVRVPAQGDFLLMHRLVDVAGPDDAEWPV